MSLTISDKGLNIIKKYEGCRLTAYKCPAGVWTIGYGHTSGVTEGMKITQAQADAYLKADCKSAVNAVNKYDGTYRWNQNQFDALVSFTFNCGSANLRSLLKAGKRSISEISNAIPLYNKASGKVLNGLIKRRADEKKLFDTVVKTNNEELPTLKNGSTGKAVKVWQIILGVNVDGKFGANTLTATKAFQKNNGLTADGVVGAKTWKAGLGSL